MSTTLYGWGPMFGVRCPSPFVLKADVQLQLLNVPFERAIADLETVPKHKAPYVVDDGRLIEDSTFIRWHFQAKTGRDLDEGLSTSERAVAWAFERLLEDRLVMLMAHERWLVPENFEAGPSLFFGRVPEAARQGVIEQVLADLRQMMVRHGVGRHSRDERAQLAAADLAALTAQLGDKPYLMGDRMTAVDATAYGVISSCSAPVFSGPLTELVRGNAALMAYLQRIDARFWPAG